MRRRWSVVLAALAALACAPRAAPASPAACAATPLCRCSADQLACDAVPYYRFPEIGAGVSHVALWSARLSELPEAALDGRALRSLVLVAARLHRLHPAAFASMTTSLASLDLGHNELAEVPLEVLRRLRALNWLNLQNNHVVELDPAADWGGLADSLSWLSLSNNRLQALRAGALAALRRLATLELDGNRLQQLDAGALPPALDALHLADNLLRRLPCAGLLLPRLRHLQLRNNALRPADADVDAGCPAPRARLESLDLSDNDLADDFRLDFRPPQLKRLMLDLNDFTTVPAFVQEFGRLERLSMSHNNVRRVPAAALRALAGSLRRLELEHNELAALPAGVSGLARLRHLALSYNDLSDLGELPPELHALLLAGNALTSLPSGLRNLTRPTLAYLDLGYNRISRVSADSFGPWAGRLSTLILRGNRIAQLSVGAFPPLPLRELILSFNDLYHVEAGVFANLTQLKVLELSTTSFGGDVPAGSTLEALTWLGLDNNNIHRVSTEDIQSFPSLEYLDLDFNKIIEFPSDGKPGNGSGKLKELRLSYNFISKIHSDFLRQLAGLQSADFSCNRLRDVNARAFAEMTELIYLNLAENEIAIVADGAFTDLPKLEALDMQKNGLVEFSLRFFNNVSNDEANLIVNVSYNRISSLSGAVAVPITILDLSFNSLQTVYRDFFESMRYSLRQVLLSHNRIVHVDGFAFGSMPHLIILNLQNNSISVVKRRAFAEMPSLQMLDLSHNEIPQLSIEQFHNLRTLRYLNLASNRLRALPRDALANTLLENLDLSNNRLTLFPRSTLAQVGWTLRRLELSRNRLEYLDAAALRAAAHLHELGLAGNALTALPDTTLAALPRLRRLDLAYNNIKANFRELFGGVPELRRLSLAGVGLRTVPQLVLPDLTELNLSGNHINSYGRADVKHLASLRALDVSANHFTSLRPAMWAALPHLLALDVSHNPIVRLPKGALEGLERLEHLRMIRLGRLEAVEPRAFGDLGSLRTLAVDSRGGEGQRMPLAEIALASQFIEALVILFIEEVLESQLAGLRAPKLRSLEVRGAALRRVGARAFESLGRQRALVLRVTHTAVSELPAGLVLPLLRVPHLALDVSDNRLLSFGPDVLYPNRTGWSRLATKLIPGGLTLSNNPVRCGCAAAWAGGWLRRWASEVGGGARAAREAARRGTCLAAAGGARALVSLSADAAKCRARAPASPAPPPVLLARTAAILALVLLYWNFVR
ncbi:chaoptin-like [Aricia agestis]|uniref:chaoptin-like n=1 Tax=Aricia agestis TaxID=91739 RepID=UPI001C201B22|nr:chaoptin-like [Aricia agestis]